MMTVDLRRKLQEERCPKNSNIKAHLSKLEALRKELTAMSADPANNNFIIILLSSPPASYNLYLAVLTAISALLSQTITPDVYVHGISNKADRRQIKNCAKKEKKAVFNTNSGFSRHGE